MIAETMISGEWMTGLIVAVIGAVGSALVAYKKGAQSVTETKLSSPVPTVPTLKVITPPSWDQHRALEARVAVLEERFTQQERLQTERFVKLMEAGETRKDAIMEKISNEITTVYARLNQLADAIRPRTK